VTYSIGYCAIIFASFAAADDTVELSRNDPQHSTWAACRSRRRHHLGFKAPILCGQWQGLCRRGDDDAAWARLVLDGSWMARHCFHATDDDMRADTDDKGDDAGLVLVQQRCCGCSRPSGDSDDSDVGLL
jgi:hypothetical protein